MQSRTYRSEPRCEFAFVRCAVDIRNIDVESASKAGVLVTQELDASVLLASADALFAQAMQDFIAMRAREGAALHELVEARLQGIEREVGGVRERMPQILQHFRSKLLARVAEARAELSVDRLEQEVVLFAQKMDVFCELVERVQHPCFGVNYDPSNAFLAGDDPLELLQRVKHRVVTMHASDRTLIEGTLEDLRREEGGAEGYAKRLRHGEIGKGLNDYDAIFGTLRGVGFAGRFFLTQNDGTLKVNEARLTTALSRIDELKTFFSRSETGAVVWLSPTASRCMLE